MPHEIFIFTSRRNGNPAPIELKLGDVDLNFLIHIIVISILHLIDALYFVNNL